MIFPALSFDIHFNTALNRRLPPTNQIHMARFVIALILFSHGLIHLLGFAKEFRLVKAEGLFSKTGTPLSADSAKIA